MKNLLTLDKSIYTGVKVVKKTHPVTDAELERQINAIRAKNAYLEETEGKAENGDVCNIDYEGFKDGVPFRGGKGTNTNLELGSHMFIPGFEEQLVGHAKGEDVDVKVVFPVQYQERSLAGKPAVFKVKINSVSKKVIPEFDDEFAKNMGEGTAEAFRETIRTEMQKMMDQKLAENLSGDLIKQVCINGRLTATPEMADEAGQEMIDEFKTRLALSSQSFERFLKMQNMTEEKFENQVRAQAKSSAHIRAMFATVAAQENLLPEDKDIEEFYENVAKSAHKTVEFVKEVFPRELAAGNIAMQRAARFIHDNAEITEA